MSWTADQPVASKVLCNAQQLLAIAPALPLVVEAHHVLVLPASVVGRCHILILSQ